jgi:diguanylate cyclase (GGDEF)-like protein
MEELIHNIFEKTVEELEKANKPPYPLYYKNIFVSLTKEEGVFQHLNPKLLCIEEPPNEKMLSKTLTAINTVSMVSEEIKKDSEMLVEEVAPLQIDEIKDTILQFSTGLMEKIKKLEETVRSLECELDKAYKELLIDPLTKAYNRKALEKDLEEILEKGKDRDLDMVVAVVDLDNFKEVNDRYGHLVGDFVLVKIVEFIKRVLRSENRVYRYGGDEFIIVFNRMDLDNVKRVIERLIKKIDKTLLKYKDQIIKVTISVGVTRHHKGDTFETIIKRADEALYEAKKNKNMFSIKE